MNEKPLPAFLRFEQDRLFVTQEMLAALCKVSPKTLHLWIKGKSAPSFLEEMALRSFLPSLGAGCAEKILCGQSGAAPELVIRDEFGDYVDAVNARHPEAAAREREARVSRIQGEPFTFIQHLPK